MLKKKRSKTSKNNCRMECRAQTSRAHHPKKEHPPNPSTGEDSKNLLITICQSDSSSQVRSSLDYPWSHLTKCLLVEAANSSLLEFHSLKVWPSGNICKTQLSPNSSSRTNSSHKDSTAWDSSKQMLVICRITWLGVTNTIQWASLEWRRETCRQLLLIPRCPITTSLEGSCCRRAEVECSLTEQVTTSITQWLHQCTCLSWMSLPGQKLEVPDTKIKTQAISA